MKRLNISSDIVPIGEFKAGLSKWLKSVQNSGHPLVITQNGRPAGVLLSPSEYDELVYKRHFLDSVNRGLSDAESGNVYTSNELKEELEKRRQRGPK
ncbi:MAG: type II toxin-antitoxin system Phd/YefM family antitoxin [bacterium]